MVSTFGSLNTVVTGLQSHQTRLATVGHNISNASTDGFSRQRVNVVASNSQRVYTSGGMAQLGLGVRMQSITRIRDTFIDRQYWKETPLYATHKTSYSLLTKLEDVFGEPSATGLESIMNTFWESMNTVSKEASNVSARAVAIEEGNQLARTVTQEADQFFSMVKEVNDTIKLRIGSVNEITREIVALNKKITAIEAGDIDNANDLRDRRDWLVDNLASIMDIRVVEDERGAFLINGGGGVPLVTATDSYDLEVVSSKDSDYDFEVLTVISPKLNNMELDFKNGEIAALMTFTGDGTGPSSTPPATEEPKGDCVKKYLNDLSNMAKFLLQEFNDIHKAGIDLNGKQGLNFFGTNGVDYNDTATVGGYKMGDWIKNLKINDELADSKTGAFKLAVRTPLGEAQQSNPQGGHAVLGFKGTDAEGFVSGLDPNMSIILTVDAVDANGNVTAVSCSLLDNSTTPPTPIAPAPTITPTARDTGSTVFTLTGLGDDTMGEFTVQIARVADGNAIGNTYTFNTGANPAMQGIAGGDNAINLCSRLKNDISATIGDSSLDTYYATVIGVLGSQAKDAERLADNQKLVTDNLLELRESVCGVNQDEELADMIKFQKAYDSASRILTAMDEMLERLINGTGRVGA